MSAVTEQGSPAVWMTHSRKPICKGSCMQSISTGALRYLIVARPFATADP